MPEHFINNIETILKKSGLQLYRPKSGTNIVNNLTKCVYFRATSFNFGMLEIRKSTIVSPDIGRHKRKTHRTFTKPDQ